MQRFFLLQVITPHYHQELALENMQELEDLVKTYGGQAVEKSVQHRVKPHPNTYIGTGKVEWLKEQVKAQKINVVVLNDIVNSGQLFRLEKSLWEVNRQIQVWDRVDLILNIFEQHATTTEARLQIQLARIRHLGPRVYGLGKTLLSRQGGGIGTRGAGETNIELERRNIRKMTQKLEQQLKKLSQDKEQRIRHRKERGLSTVALVGYTSAGKTSLFNALTSKRKEAHAKLFTTLDSSVGKFSPGGEKQKILLSDTIGFIQDLPPSLIEAFRSTLLESIQADLLLHVVDVGDPKIEEKMEVVNEILHELEIHKKPLFVFNKIDQLQAPQIEALQNLYSAENVHFVSAKTGEGIEKLKEHVFALLQKAPRNQ